MTIEEIILTFTYLGILVLMTTNGVISFPSSQILYIITGYFIFTGDLVLVYVLLVGAIGNTIGNIVLYEITRRKGVKYILKWNIFPEVALIKAQKVFEKHGPYFLFIGKLLPALKVFMPIVAGMSKMNRILYGVIIFITSFIWASIFISLGYFFGKGTEVYGIYIPFLLIIALIVVYIFFRIMNSEDVIEEMNKRKK